MNFPFEERLNPPTTKEHQIGPNVVGIVSEGFEFKVWKNNVVGINAAPFSSQISLLPIFTYNLHESQLQTKWDKSASHRTIQRVIASTLYYFACRLLEC